MKVEGYVRLIGDGYVIIYILKLKVYFIKLNIFEIFSVVEYVI